MLLERYLAKGKVTDAEFARQLGVSAEYVRLLKLGRRSPSVGVMRRIRDVTEGAVQPNDFVSTEAA